MNLEGAYLSMLEDFFRVCCWCGDPEAGSWATCTICWRTWYEPVLRPGGLREWGESQMPVLSCFDWDVNNDQRLRALMLALKGGYPKSSFAFFAKMLFLRNLTPLEGRVLVPAPRGNPRTEESDHALALAEAIAEISGLTVFKGLKKSFGPAQKSLRAMERQSVSLWVEGTVPKGPLIFVDDVITTGATALEAYRALGRPSDFQAWAVSCRAKDPLLYTGSEFPQ